MSACTVKARRQMLQILAPPRMMLPRPARLSTTSVRESSWLSCATGGRTCWSCMPRPTLRTRASPPGRLPPPWRRFAGASRRAPDRLASPRCAPGCRLGLHKCCALIWRHCSTVLDDPLRMRRCSDCVKLAAGQALQAGQRSYCVSLKPAMSWIHLQLAEHVQIKALAQLLVRNCSIFHFGRMYWILLKGLHATSQAEFWRRHATLRGQGGA